MDQTAKANSVSLIFDEMYTTEGEVRHQYQTIATQLFTLPVEA